MSCITSTMNCPIVTAYINHVHNLLTVTNDKTTRPRRSDKHTRANEQQENNKSTRQADMIKRQQTDVWRAVLNVWESLAYCVLCFGPNAAYVAGQFWTQVMKGNNCSDRDWRKTQGAAFIWALRGAREKQKYKSLRYETIIHGPEWCLGWAKRAGGDNLEIADQQSNWLIKLWQSKWCS